MKRLAEFLSRNRLHVFIIYAVLFIASIFGIYSLVTGNKINYDVMEYLDEESSTAEGIAFLQDNFGISGNAIIVVRGSENDEELRTILNKTATYEGVTSMMWYGQIEDMRPLTESTLFVNALGEMDFSAMENFLRTKVTDEATGEEYYDYVIVYMFDFPPSTNEGFDLLNKIETDMTGRAFSSAGMTPMTEDMMSETLHDMPYFVIFSMLIVLVLLFIFMASYFEPIVLVITLGMAIVINMATNLILPSISFISFACSAVLQLGITMDYAIFYMHIYHEQRKDKDRLEATRHTLPLVVRSILASGLTTMIGFCALYAMRFTIGGDIANVIVKGVGLSLITVVMLQPALTYACDKQIMRTAHKQVALPFEKAASGIVKHRKLVVIICAILIIPAIIGSSLMSFSYLKLDKEKEPENSEEALATTLGNQCIIALPLYTKDESLTHADYIAELQEDEKIGDVMSIFTVVTKSPAELEDFLPLMMRIDGVSSLFKQVNVNGNAEWYTLYTLSIQGDTEDEAADATYAHIVEVTDRYFANYYAMGTLTGAQDMKATSGHDITFVTLFSVLAILLVVSVLFRSLAKGLIMVAVIELGIWLNFAISYAFGESINFMIYIIISSVQLGCTVDYAILIASKYEQLRSDGLSEIEAAKTATASSVPAVMLSAIIIISACMTVNVISENMLIDQLTFLMSRGAFLSLILVCTLLPCCLTYAKRIVIPLSKFIRKRNRVAVSSSEGTAQAVDSTTIFDSVESDDANATIIVDSTIQAQDIDAMQNGEDCNEAQDKNSN